MPLNGHVTVTVTVMFRYMLGKLHCYSANPAGQHSYLDLLIAADSKSSCAIYSNSASSIQFAKAAEAVLMLWSICYIGAVIHSAL